MGVVHPAGDRPECRCCFDTFHHFAQTLTYRDELVERWKLNLINLRAPEPQLVCGRRTDGCCARHKVGPFFRARVTDTVHGPAASAVGVREPAAIEPFTPKAETPRKVSPLAEWTTKDVCYAKAALTLPALYELGYVSIGCSRARRAAPDDPNNAGAARLKGPHRAVSTSAFRRTF
jgi:phosphoadenosine phosphosulfate reductase